MSNIKKVNCDFEIIEIENPIKFAINNKDNAEKITIFNKDMIEDIIDKKFMKKYRELLHIAMDIENSEDASDSDIELALIKVDVLKEVLLNKYSKFLNKEAIKKYIKMILLLQEKLNIPIKHRGR